MRMIGPDTRHYEPAMLIIEAGATDRPAMLVALLTLSYGLPLASILGAHRRDFDLATEVWRLPDGLLPLTPPFLYLVRSHLVTCGSEPGSPLFTGQDGRPLSPDEAERRVLILTRSWFSLDDLRDDVLGKFDYFPKVPARLSVLITKQTATGTTPEALESYQSSRLLMIRGRLHVWQQRIRLGELLAGHHGDYASMLEEDIQHLRRQLQAAKESISHLVEMNDKLKTQLQKKQAWMANLEAEITEQLSEEAALNKRAPK